MKRKILSIFMVLIMMITFTACGSKKKEKEEKKETPVSKVNIIKIAASYGAPAMGLVKVFDDAEEKKGNLHFERNIIKDPKEIMDGLFNGNFDIAALPANEAAKVYNKLNQKDITVININSLGVLNIASRNNIKDIKELKGKTIVTAGEKEVEGAILKYILEKNNLKPDKDVKIDFKESNYEVKKEVTKNKKTIALLPQPLLSEIESENPEFKANLSFNKLWNKINPKRPLVSGVLVVNNKFLEKHKDLLLEFMKSYKNSIKFVNDNAKEAAKLMSKYDILPEKVAEKAIPNCNIVFIDGEDMKKDLSEYFNIIYNENKSVVGGSLPTDSFYYEK